MREVYLDNNATTPLHPGVQEEIKSKLALFGNASSAHRFGRAARAEVEQARKKLAQFLNTEPESIMFTSGGSESNNLVLKGLTCMSQTCTLMERGRNHIITSQIEHPSVLNTCKCLEHLGYEVSYAPVDGYGVVDLEFIEKNISPKTILISVMWANNEVGTIQPVEEIARLAHERGVFFHTDAVQVIGKQKVDLGAVEIDYLSLSGHKFYAPKGIGAVYYRKGVPVCPLIHGGHQEFNLRGGTENTLGILAMGKAIELLADEMDDEIERVRRLRDRLEQGILERIPDVKVNGHPEKRLPGTLNVSFRYVEGESILYKLDAKGIAVSTGSACSTGSLEPSHVLMAMGLTHEIAHGSIRFSLGRENTDEDV
nr:aminotransferase class V-fold PLP-dependent enzyme [Bacillota bacterium]